MKKFVTFMSVVLAAGSMAVANDYIQQFRTREVVDAAVNADALKTDAKVFYAGPSRAGVLDYGTTTTILFEDFSLMRAGAEGAPDKMDLYDKGLEDIKDNVWQSMKPGYTKTPDWGCHNLYQAGGMVYMDSEPEERDPMMGMLIKEGRQSQFNPTLIDNTAYDPYIIVRFSARAANAEIPGQMLVEVAETNHMQHGEWTIFGGQGALVESEDWYQYEAVIPASGPSLIVSIVSIGGAVYVDDFEVLGLTQFVGTPVPVRHTNYLGTSFTANWTAARDAEGYRLTVTTYNDETGEYDNVLDHFDVGNVTSYTVENVVSGQDYYYSVEAYKGAYTSIESDLYEVHDVERPAPLGEAQFSEDGTFYVSWPEVPAAEVYNYKYYYDRKAAQDGEFVIWDEDFEGLVDFDGELGVVEFEEIGHIDGAYPGPYYVNGLKMGAWEAYSYYCGKGFLGICSFFLTHNGQPSQFESPALDLSKDGGKFKFSLDLRSHDGRDPKNGILPGVHDMPQAIIAIAHYDEATGDYVTTAQYYTRAKGMYDQDEINGVKFYFLNDRVIYDDWKTYELECEGGTENTKIIIFAYEGIDYLAIDNIKLTQNYKAGEIFRHPVNLHQWISGTEEEFELPEYVQAESPVEIYHQLESVRARVMDGGMGGQYMVYTNSGFGELSYAGTTKPSGVETIVAPEVEANIYVNNGVLYVLGTDEAVSVYAVNGAQIAAANGELSVALGQHGVYVVKVGDKAVKVVY